MNPDHKKGVEVTSQPASREQSDLAGFVNRLGIDPLAAVALIAADFMLFGVEASTAGLGIVLTIPIGILLGLASMLLQRYRYADCWSVSVAKGIILAILTAIPTPIMSAVIGAAGIMGRLSSSTESSRAPESAAERYLQ